MPWIDDKFVAFDFETSGELPEYALQPWRVAQGKAWATSLAVIHYDGTTVHKYGGLDPTVDLMRDILTEASANGRRFVGWNTPFDISWFLAYGLEEEVFKCKWLDGMLLWRHWEIEPQYDMNREEKKSYGLKSFVREYMPDHAGYEEDIDFHDPDPAVRAKLHKYNMRDTLSTLLGARMFWRALEEDSPARLRAALIEADSLPLVAQANLRGMVVDVLATRELEANLTARAAELLGELEPHGVTEKVVRSPTQLAKTLYDDWGLPVLKENEGKKTGKISRATDKAVLHELAFIDDRAKLVREYREALGNRTKFATAILESVDYNEDGNTHPQAIVFGTYSGRITISSKQGKGKSARQIGFAQHQEKRGKEYRDVIIAPPGYTILEFDAAGQEYRWMAIASGDETMLNLCLPGEDPHSYMGAKINHVDYHDLMKWIHGSKAEKDHGKPMRQLGKIGNLSLQYRTSAKRLLQVARVDYSIPMELPEAKRIHLTYRRVYPGVPKYWDTQIQLTKRLGYVETFAGRRVQVLGDWSRDGWQMGSTAINYRIQGTGADQKYLALSVIKPYLTQIGAYFAWDLHDGIYLYVPDDKVARAIPDIRHLLNNLPYKQAWGFTPPIPMPWDVKVGKAWGSLEEISA